MKIYYIIQPRNTGKTTKAIYEYQKESEISLFVSYNKETSLILAKSLKTDKKDFIGSENIKDVLIGEKKYKNIILDEYDLFLNKKEIYILITSLIYKFENLYIYLTPNKLYNQDYFHFIKNQKEMGFDYETVKTNFIQKYNLESISEYTEQELSNLYYNFITNPNTKILNTMEYLYAENSDKYYKGFRYDKDEEGNDCWYDDNGESRKRIGYYSNGKKSFEEYFDKDGLPHNEYGYAAFEWDEDGNIEYQSYYLNGKELTEQEWKEKTGKIETIEPESDKYYKGFRYEKDIVGRDYKSNLFRKITYYDNGNTKKKVEEYFNTKHEYHNEDGYAFQSWYEDGSINLQYYYLNGIELTEQQWKEEVEK